MKIGEKWSWSKNEYSVKNSNFHFCCSNKVWSGTMGSKVSTFNKITLENQKLVFLKFATRAPKNGIFRSSVDAPSSSEVDFYRKMLFFCPENFFVPLWRYFEFTEKILERLGKSPHIPIDYFCLQLDFEGIFSFILVIFTTVCLFPGKQTNCIFAQKLQNFCIFIKNNRLCNLKDHVSMRFDILWEQMNFFFKKG